MQDAQAEQQPSSPHHHLDDVLTHHLPRTGILQMTLAEVLLQQIEGKAVDVFEHKEERYHLDDAEEAHGEVVDVDELAVENLPRQRTQIEHVGSHVDAQRYRHQRHPGQHNGIDKAEEPCLRGRLLVQLLTIAVELHPVDEACDGQDAGQLHDPPDEQLDAQQRIAHPRADGAGDENAQRHIGVEHVAARNAAVVTPHGPPLPQSATKQYRREAQVHQVVGYQDDAERDDDEAHHYQWCIDAEGALDLIAIDTQQQRHQDDT